MGMPPAKAERVMLGVAPSYLKPDAGEVLFLREASDA
jgi:hypothetical protein